MSTSATERDFLTVRETATVLGVPPDDGPPQDPDWPDSGRSSRPARFLCSVPAEDLKRWLYGPEDEAA